MYSNIHNIIIKTPENISNAIKNPFKLFLNISHSCTFTFYKACGFSINSVYRFGYFIILVKACNETFV